MRIGDHSREVKLVDGHRMGKPSVQNEDVSLLASELPKPLAISHVSTDGVHKGKRRVQAVPVLIKVFLNAWQSC